MVFSRVILGWRVTVREAKDGFHWKAVSGGNPDSMIPKRAFKALSAAVAVAGMAIFDRDSESRKRLKWEL